MNSAPNFSFDLEKLEKEIRAENKIPEPMNLDNNISKNYTVGTDFDTIEEPIIVTLKRDSKLLYEKFSQVLFPSKLKKNILADWDLWGPLFICILLSLFLQGAEKGAQFTQIFSLALFGSIVVTLNAKLLGGKISFFQALCVIGYCLLPFVFTSIVIKVFGFFTRRTSFFNLFIRLNATIFGFSWTYYDMDPKKLSNVKPNYGLDKCKERQLLHIATRGVTQLFNATTERQKCLRNTLDVMKTRPRNERKQIIDELKNNKRFDDVKIGRKRKRHIEQVEEKKNPELTEQPNLISDLDNTVEIKEH